ncbi:VOC family protein [Tomitella biformata]|uniref:VOC family protein n=1 Tax=Tomitella biformata TaxID=630403 RepID=UPI000464F9C5|nr:VOC family protein [Tomitella biformata]
MTVRPLPLGTPCWIDLMSSDTAAAIDFYSAVFGWQADVSDDPRYGGYGTFSKYDSPVAGVMPAQEGNPDQNVWSVYLATDDIAASSAKAESAGGQVIMPAMTVPEQGQMAMLTDPAGAVISLWQAGGHNGFDRSERPGTPVWFESMSRDYAKAVPFYTDVFDLTAQVQGDTDEFRYSTLTRAGEDLAGLMDADGFLPAGVPSFWQVYISSADVDATLAAVIANGGTVDRPAEDTPYGRMAGVADPLGARFCVITRPAS